MRKVQVCIEVEEDDYRAYEVEARRQDTSVQAMVERMLQGLFDELKKEERAGDHPILFP